MRSEIHRNANLLFNSLAEDPSFARAKLNIYILRRAIPEDEACRVFFPSLMWLCLLTEQTLLIFISTTGREKIIRELSETEINQLFLGSSQCYTSESFQTFDASRL